MRDEGVSDWRNKRPTNVNMHQHIAKPGGVQKTGKRGNISPITTNSPVAPLAMISLVAYSDGETESRISKDVIQSLVVVMFAPKSTGFSLSYFDQSMRWF